MPTISEMIGNAAHITVTFHNLTVNVEYYPGKVTERVIKTIRNLSKASGDDIDVGFDNLNNLIVELIQSWDLTEDDETTMFPLDATRLPELPLPFRTKLLTSIMQNMRPEE